MYIARSSFVDALKPIISQWWGQYEAKEKYCDTIFSILNSEEAYEDERKLIGFGLAQVKGEGAPITYDDTQQGILARYQHIAYGKGYQLTREMVDDGKYMPQLEMLTRALLRSMEETREVVAAEVFNDAFTANSHDGVPLLATNHPTKSAGTYSNELDPAQSLTEAAIEDLQVLIYNATDENGLRIKLRGTDLIVPPAEMHNGARILGAMLQPGTANNDPNAMRVLDMLPTLRPYPYLDSSTAWYLKTNCPQGLQLYDRVAIEKPLTDNDFDTHNARVQSYMRFSVGATDAHGLYGSAAA